MATKYVDFAGGNDSNDGSSFANRKKTLSSVSGVMSASDTCRIMMSPAETSLGMTAAWTANSKTVTLNSALTANITDCETAWTASANVTSTADTAQYKENTKSAKHVIASGFTTGLASYFATGTLDLSGYKQVSFWVYNTAAIAASTLSLRLCSDTAGVTTVNTIAIPAIPSTNQWVPITVDTGAALGSAIASVALYCDLDPGSVTVQLDNIIACKDSTAADALTLVSLIGKVHNLTWAASTSYSVNDIRKPTPPNRNGLRYKVTAQSSASGSSEPTWPTEIGATVTDGGVTWTCEGVEDTWYGIQSINGTTVKLDADTTTLGNAGRGYGGATETVTTYKREPFNQTMVTGGTTAVQLANRSGVDGSPTIWSGGWNSTDMSTQTGETWISGQNSLGVGYSENGTSYIKFVNLHAVRCSYGWRTQSMVGLALASCSANNCSRGFELANSMTMQSAIGIICCNNTLYGIFQATSLQASVVWQVVRADNNTQDGIRFSNSVCSVAAVRYASAKNNGAYGINQQGTWPPKLSNVVTGNNASGAVLTNNAYPAFVNAFNCSFPEATQFATRPLFSSQYIYSQKEGQTADSHLISYDVGSIISATDQRHTASGIAWKFRPTNLACRSDYPIKLSVAKIAVAANAQVTVSIWTRRDSTNIKGLLVVEGGQIGGVARDVTVSCQPSVNTWTQSSDLTFTPTEAGVVDVQFWVWDGAGTTNNFWIDDFSASQA